MSSFCTLPYLRFGLIGIFLSSTILSIFPIHATPLIPGLGGKHPLDERGIGEVLLGELRCGACHADEYSQDFHRQGAPDLISVGQRLSPEYLRRFLADPVRVQPGVKMPDLLAGQSTMKRSEVADALTHFLVSLSGSPIVAKPNPGNARAGRILFHDIGCVACHSAQLGNGSKAVADGLLPLAHVPIKYDHHSLSGFLFNPHQARPSGRMPDFYLSGDESRDLAEYLMGGKSPSVKPFKVSAELVDKGRAYFREFNCVACHSLDREPPARQSLPLTKLNPSRGCLSTKPKDAPDYNLSDIQRKAIARALTSSRSRLSAGDAIAHSLTAFNCIACHARDDYGGPSKEFLPHLKTSEQGLGNQAKIPPGLTLAGAKLKPGWMHKVLFDGESARPYMHTRMPGFGEANLGFLPALLAGVDKVEIAEFPEPGRKERGSIRSAGHKLIGDKGLNCITCHNFNGKESPGFKGMDLLTSYDRLQPAWYYHFMRNPAKYRPGIVMPNYWAGSKGARGDILGGDTDAQVWAIWHYFSYGQGAPTPSGIHNPGSNIEVGGVVRTYRGRSRIAGYRGIAVGFPGGLNYAFDAATGTLSGIWRGDFVSVGWGGQGAGSFNPRSRSINLPRDVSFLQRFDEKEKWPLLPVMTKENPVNPDPLYPRNLGYRFLGYAFDDAFVPTFSYRCGDVGIEDVSVAGEKDGHALLKRTLKFVAPAAQTLHFRVIAGKVEAVSDTHYKTPDLKLKLPVTTTILRRPLGADPALRELILKLDLPKGETRLLIDYELLR
ncbi:MAG: hypothetical protein HN675_01740 [Opitutae bacterium]|nr:hypothetical protein [Opitutae bacterium]